MRRRTSRRTPATIFAGLTLGALALAGCSSPAATTAASESDTQVQAASDVSSDYAELTYDALGLDDAAAVDESKAVDVTLADGGSSAQAGVSVNGDTVTITAAGTYRLSGSLSAGSVVVDVESGQVNLILDGVAITADDTAAINVVSADSVVVYLAGGSVNSLSDSATASASTDEDAPTAVLYSKADLFIEGSGSLTVSASINDGITSKDSLIIEGGTIAVDAVDDGVNGKDHIVVLDGTLSINAGGDGIKSDNDEVLTDTTSTKGVAWVSGGSVDITAGDDGIQAQRQVTIDGGAVTVSAADDGVHSEGVLSINDGSVDVTESYEGLEGAVVLLTGGTGSITSSDDGINAAGGYLTESASATDNAGGDAAGGGGQEMPGGGERPSGDIGAGGGDGDRGGDRAGGAGGGTGGDASVTDPSQLTVTASSGSDMGGAMGGDSSDAGRYLSLSGGSWTVDAQGDGVDVNGSIVISGGTLTVAGPSADNNSAIDADTGFTITGGTVTSNGSSGMLVAPGDESTQASVVAVFSGGVAAGSVITVTDASGEELVNYTTVRVSQSIIFSSADIVAGDSYTIAVDGTEVGSVAAQ